MRDDNTEMVEIACEFVHETDKAWLVNDGEKDHWIPKSISDYDRGDTISIQMWFAKKEGMI